MRWQGEVIFTSGASEALQIGLLRSRAEITLVSSVEHDSVFQLVPDAVHIPVNKDGSLNIDFLSEKLGSRSAVVAVQHINSETGNRQNINLIKKIVTDLGGMLLVDCSQSTGKIDIPNCDMAIVSAHKFGGPIGVGALLVRDYDLLTPSGGHERGYRRGTENLPGILGMSAALIDCKRPYVQKTVLEPLLQLSEDCRSLGGLWLSDHLADPNPLICAISMPNLSAASQVVQFDLRSISVSQGSACSSGTMKRSNVMSAMQLDESLSDKIIRVSFGWSTTRADVEQFCNVWLDLAKS